MFKQSDDMPHSKNAETIIGPSVQVDGDLIAVGNVAIDGMVKGTISTDKDIVIGSDAEISANIKGANATIGGLVEGKIEISGHLTLLSSARINGDISTGSISIENGAHINGNLTMGSSPTTSSDHQAEEASTKSEG